MLAARSSAQSWRARRVASGTSAAAAALYPQIANARRSANAALRGQSAGACACCSPRRRSSHRPWLASIRAQSQSDAEVGQDAELRSSSAASSSLRGRAAICGRPDARRVRPLRRRACARVRQADGSADSAVAGEAERLKGAVPLQLLAARRSARRHRQLRHVGIRRGVRTRGRSLGLARVRRDRRGDRACRRCGRPSSRQARRLATLPRGPAQATPESHDQLPDCGLYRTGDYRRHSRRPARLLSTTTAIPVPGFIFQNRGAPREPGGRGTTAPADFDARALLPPPAEGLYRVTAAFFCCSKQCVKYEPEMLVQLGYNGHAALVFAPGSARTA